MNPARSLGPALVMWVYNGIWIYVVGPFVGAILGATCYNLIRYTDKPLREIGASSKIFKTNKLLNIESKFSELMLKHDLEVGTIERMLHNVHTFLKYFSARFMAGEVEESFSMNFQVGSV
ncbi:hypothetical protein JHK85_019899 [Glycine max]|nr:hypothetical protein JHK85_019899 [Glycine max]